MASRILVTGGCGFVGRHLVDAFMARGDEVTHPIPSQVGAGSGRRHPRDVRVIPKSRDFH